MIYLTQLIYVKEGQEQVFYQFEDVAIPLIAKYNGQLLLRIQPTDDSFIEQPIDKPYELHLVRFETEQDFRAFQQDESRKQFLHLKEQSVRTSMLIRNKLNNTARESDKMGFTASAED
ncbi:DUF1330 domain-containing protein [Spirosoma taeanense]|uniref:DUF1330 domain-containing protein n=1 Tax=Spirosoma taeanense TaxID=2735870 RepID=A0A6M5Y244_9BACT|nr:DUF1330 domain-containing protein [Spirosoma taeanense]QJW88748.1 DUF1330 domain-containing protein [Spirosoma taeanense]